MESYKVLQVTTGDVLSDVLAPYFGSVWKAARAMGTTAPTLHRRRNEGRRLITAEEAVRVEVLTDGRLQRSTLRPDLWPTSNWEAIDYSRREYDLFTADDVAAVRAEQRR